MIERCSTRLNYLRSKDQRAHPRPKRMLDKGTRRALKKLQKHLVLVPVDKASNNIALVCRKLYCHVVRSELSSDSNAYKLSDKEQAEIISTHKKYLQPFLLYGQDILPFLYMSPKFHKDPIGYRFVASSARCTTSVLSKVLSSVLIHILRTLREKDNESLCASGVRRYFIVESYEEVTGFLSRWRRIKNLTRNGLYTGDFSAMYTGIPHKELFTAIDQATRESFDWAADKYSIPTDQICIKWTGSSCMWVKSCHSDHSKSSHTFTHKQLNTLVRWLVSNTFLLAGKSTHRQTIGIPMGTNCAPALANLYLYYYESAYISRLESKEGVAAARSFHMTFRLIDDVLSADNPLMASALRMSAEKGGMYPAALTLNKTSTSSEEADFIGVTIKSRGVRFHTSVYDKRKSFPFFVRRYPLMSSLIPRTIPYGVFMGLLHRGYRTCSGVNDFLSYALDVATVLRENGCASNKLKILFKSFVASYVRKYPGIRGTLLMKQFCQRLGSNKY